MSKPQVTITLGRSGQVVKRTGSVTESFSNDNVPLSGSKRSIRDRLGNNAEKSSLNGNQQKNKRQRRDGNKRSLEDDDVDGVRVNRNDLRYKLMRKKMSRKTWSDGEGKQINMDLREKLSRAAQPPLRPDTRQQMPEPKATGILRRIPPNRSADDLLQMDSLRKSYSPWTLEGLRRRSPDRLLGSSRGLSPPRRMDDRRPVGPVAHADASRPTPFIGRDVYDASRPTSFMPKTSVPLEAGKPVVRLPPAPSITQKITYMGEEPQPLTVASLLHSLGLGKYAILFQAEEVDMTALKQMGDHDLKELGIPMGPRKKILLSVAGRSKRQP